MKFALVNVASTPGLLGCRGIGPVPVEVRKPRYLSFGFEPMVFGAEDMEPNVRSSRLISQES